MLGRALIWQLVVFFAVAVVGISIAVTLRLHQWDDERTECREAAESLGVDWKYRQYDGCFIAEDYYWHKIDPRLVIPGEVDGD